MNSYRLGSILGFSFLFFFTLYYIYIYIYFLHVYGHLSAINYLLLLLFHSNYEWIVYLLMCVRWQRCTMKISSKYIKWNCTDMLHFVYIITIKTMSVRETTCDNNAFGMILSVILMILSVILMLLSVILMILSVLLVILSVLLVILSVILMILSVILMILSVILMILSVILMILSVLLVILMILSVILVILSVILMILSVLLVCMHLDPGLDIPSFLFIYSRLSETGFWS